MLEGAKNQIKGYLILLREKPEKKLSKRKLRKLEKIEAKRLKKAAKKGKITLKTGGKGLDKAAPPAGPGRAVAEVREPTVPEIRACLNCGAKLTGKFCSRCGQKDSDYRRPYWTFLEDITDNVISKDSRLWRTLGYLLFLPGAMTREYIAGRRIRFLPPIRTFLISIVLFFMTVNVLNVAILKFTGEPITYQQRLEVLQGRLANEEADIEKYTARGNGLRLEDATLDRDDLLADIQELEDWRAEQLSRPDQDQVRRTEDGQLIYDYNVEPEMFAQISSDDKALPEDIIADAFQFDTGADDDDPEFLAELAPKVERGLKNAAQDPKRLNNALNNWVPLIMGIFVPLTAIFLRFYYWKREHFLYNQLVFSLHFHTYMFFLLTFFVIAQVYLGSSVSTWMFTAALPLYFFIGLKVATGQGWFRTFFKFLVISLFYTVGFSMMLLAVFIAAFSEA